MGQPPVIPMYPQTTNTNGMYYVPTPIFVMYPPHVNVRIIFYYMEII